MHASLFSLLPLLALVSAGPITKRQNLGTVIVSGRDSSLCLSVEGGREAAQGGKLTNGTLVTSIPCGVASFWDIAEGSGSVIVTGTDFALDIGLEPANHGGLKVWKSYPTAPQQTWYLTPDHRIAQTGGDQCLDQGDDRAQTYQCTTGNTNQVWNVVSPVPLPTVTPTTIAIANATGPAYTLISGSYGPNSTLVGGTVIPVHTLIVSSHGPNATVSVSSHGPAQTLISGSYANPAATPAAVTPAGSNYTLASGSSYVGIAQTVISGSYAVPAATGGNTLGSGSTYVGTANTLISGSYAVPAATGGNTLGSGSTYVGTANTLISGSYAAVATTTA